MKTCEEYIISIHKKAAVLKKRRMALFAGCAFVTTVLALVLFLPFGDGSGGMSRYRNNQYYDLICGLNRANTAQPLYRNNFQKLIGTLQESIKSGTDMPGSFDYAEHIPGYSTSGGYNTNSELGQFDDFAPPETDDPIDGTEDGTDNQVSGVSEADLFKRNGNTLFYLRGNVLSVYSMQGEASRLISELTVFENMDCTSLQMHLSADGTDLIVIGTQYKSKRTAVTVLNVSDPENIGKGSIVWLSGEYNTSRLVQGKLLLICDYKIAVSKVDYDDPQTYVPASGVDDQQLLFEPSEICCPGSPRGSRMTVLAALDAKTLEILGRQAVLGCAGQIYVSANAIYLSVSGTQYQSDLLGQQTVTDCSYVTGVAFQDDMSLLGSITLPGSINDRFSMDEYDGTLRVAVTLDEPGTGKNAGLYIVSLSDWEIVASVENFAPAGEQVKSARFDREQAWICTALVQEMTDPVYCFDLSDLSNITWVQTPVIDGFSSSLIRFGDTLLGLGQLSPGQWKVSLYKASDDEVEQLFSLDGYGWFPDDYHCYLVDRLNGIFAFPCENEYGQPEYMLLKITNTELLLLQVITLEHEDPDLSDVRSVINDHYLYLLDDGIQILDISEFTGG